MKKSLLRKEYFGGVLFVGVSKKLFLMDPKTAHILETAAYSSFWEAARGSKLKRDIIIHIFHLWKRERILNSKDRFESNVLDYTILGKHRLMAPLKVFLEVTSACNLRCTTCFNASGGKSEKELSYLEIIKIIEELKRIGVLELTISGGEPFMRPDIIKIIKYAIKRIPFVTLSTNGTLITPMIALKLSRLNLDRIVVSIDGGEKSNDAIRGKGAFKSALNGVKLLKRLNQKVYISATLTPFNFNEINFLVNICRDLHCDGLLLRGVINSGRASINKSIVFRKPQNYLNFLSTLRGEMNYKNIEFRKDFSLDKCDVGEQTCTITSQGNVILCRFLSGKTNIGNLRDQSLLKLWEKDRFWEELKYLKKEDFCLNCLKMGACPSSYIKIPEKLVSIGKSSK